MTDYNALVIDDEPDIRELLSITLMRMNIDCDTAESLESARARLAEKNYDLCLTDMKLPDGDGLQIVTHIQSLDYRIPVAMITAHGNMDLAIEAMKAGAFDFINKPIDIDNLRKIVQSALSTRALNQEEKSKSHLIIGQSASIDTLNANINKLARSQAPVYISGESGSGKELVARSIHALGPRKGKPFIPVNCGAIPSDLVESEFFGYVKGAFTGALQNSEGLFQAADGGTLFLDEVADLPLSMQVKILRAIQEQSIRAVGTQTEKPIDVRILSATHKPLHELVARGEFRQDLFYRINVIKVDVPPLRERPDDIELLTSHILNRLDANIDGEQTRLSKQALQVLKDYAFPGNVRELENILERAMTMCDNNTIEARDLNIGHAEPPIPLYRGESIPHFEEFKKYASIDDYLETIEKEILNTALDNCRWNKTKTAEFLGISFRSFRYRLQKLGLADEN